MFSWAFSNYPGVQLVIAGLGAAGFLGLAAALSIRWRGSVGGIVAPLIVAAAAAAFVASRSAEAWTGLAKTDGTLLALATLATGIGLHRRESRATTGCTLIAFAGLAMVYADKNPNAVRYVSLLIPVAAISIGVSVAALPMRSRRMGIAAVAMCTLALGLVVSTPTVGSDMFAGIARELRGLPSGPIVTAAPDAYGVLLRSRAIHAMREGQRGLILVDAVARAYEPDLVARGTVVGRISTTIGFLRPDGRLDLAPALVVDGVFARRKSLP